MLSAPAALSSEATQSWRDNNGARAAQHLFTGVHDQDSHNTCHQWARSISNARAHTVSQEKPYSTRVADSGLREYGKHRPKHSLWIQGAHIFAHSSALLPMQLKLSNFLGPAMGGKLARPEVIHCSARRSSCQEAAACNVGPSYKSMCCCDCSCPMNSSCAPATQRGP